MKTSKEKKREYNQRYIAKNKEKNKEQKAKWRTENKEKKKEQDRQYRTLNKDKILERIHKWRVNNPDKIKEYNHHYYDVDKESQKERHRQWRKRNKNKIKEYALIHTYGITLDEYTEIYQKQKGLCAGCYEQMKLSVDHCHKTQRIRGLLCIKCNTILGFVNDDIQILKSLISYLEKHDNI